MIEFIVYTSLTLNVVLAILVIYVVRINENQKYYFLDRIDEYEYR